jgi:ABC-type nickel/cobalt efflux system permease component RcnA
MNRRLLLPAFPIPADYLTRLLHQGDVGWGVMLAGVVVAFALGAIHALSPGHGKTIVAAYLVGTRGTPRHAAILGGMVTFTHTVTVFLLGFVTLFLSHYVLPERIYPVLGAISGIAIVCIGAVLLYQRAAKMPHSHGDGHVHSHSHIPEGQAGMASLLALGASGGLVPCPSALVLLLTAVSLGRTGLGLILLVAFSAGLAVVLTATGLVVLYAKHWLPAGERTASHAVFRYLPVASAAIVVCIGVAMTWVALRQP